MIGLLITLIVIGLLLWLVQQLPIDANIKQIFTVIAYVVIMIDIISYLE